MHNSQSNTDEIVQMAKKTSFNQGNQDAIEKNEELMSLLACLNEQAIKEMNTGEDEEQDRGM